MVIDETWRNKFNQYLQSGKVVPNMFNFVDDYVTAKLNEINTMQNIRKEKLYNWQTSRIIRHRLISIAEEAGLMWRDERSLSHGLW